jgi:hypothetical protein
VLAAAHILWVTRAALALIPFVARHWPLKIDRSGRGNDRAKGLLRLFSGGEVATSGR